MSQDLTVDVLPPLREGEETLVTVTDDLGRPVPGVTVRVLHRPELDGAQELAIGITDTLGRVRWTPELAGTAQVRADQEIVPVAIAWSGAPPDTAVVLALLAVAALGALGYGLTGGRGWRPRNEPR